MAVTCANCGGGIADGDGFCTSCGAPAPAGAGSGVSGGSTTGGAAAGGWRNPWLFGVGALVVAAVVVGAVAVALFGGGDDEDAIVLVPVDQTTPDPFTPSVNAVSGNKIRNFHTAAASEGAPASGVGRSVPGELAGLYGALPGAPVCDREALIGELEGTDAGAAWAEVAGIEPDDIGATIRSLAPVVLGGDTAVTNHAYRDGSPDAFTSVLQAGTPVLVDDRGQPRAQCSCGNPLTGPSRRLPGDAGDFDGVTWDGFDPGGVVAVEPASEPFRSLDVVDIDTGEMTTVPVGGGDVIDGLLVADEEGVHVVDPDDPTTRTTVIDRPVGRVVDDGAGGLIFTETPARPEDRDGAEPYQAPESAELATIWHLPAGSAEPEPLIAPDDPATQWAFPEATGRLDGRRVLAYASMRVDPSAVELEALSGDLVLRDLASGDEEVLDDGAYGNELGVGSVSFADDRLAFETGFEGPDWTVTDAELDQVDDACSGPDAPAPCPDPAGGLLGAERLAGSDPEGSGLVVVGLKDGQVIDRLAAPGGATSASGYELVDVEPGGDRVLVSAEPVEGGPAAEDDAVLYDVAAGGATELDITGAVRFLRAPLIRPPGSTTTAPVPDDPTPTTTPPTTAPPTTAPPTTPPPTTAPPTTAPPTPVGGSCGTVQSTIGTPVEVVVVEGDIACNGALTLADTYYNNPPSEPQGSGGFVQIGMWSCSSNSAAGTDQTGRAGTCESSTGTIELRTTG